MAVDISATQFAVSVTLYKVAVTQMALKAFNEVKYAVRRDAGFLRCKANGRRRAKLEAALNIAKYHKIQGHEARIYRAQWHYSSLTLIPLRRIEIQCLL